MTPTIEIPDQPPEPEAATVIFDHVSKTYPGHVPALVDVTFTVTPGEFVFLVGHSGSGKSTLLRLLTREETVTAGSVSIAGRDLADLHAWNLPRLRRSIGCIFQDYKLLPNRTVAANVAFALRVTGRKRDIDARVPAILRLVGLADKADRYPDQLSGGEQQRVSIARAFVNRPHVLLADEPTGNLDPDTAQGIMGLLDRINKTGTTVIMATHDAGIVDGMRRRVINLRDGHIIRDEETAAYLQTTDPVVVA